MDDFVRPVHFSVGSRNILSQLAQSAAQRLGRGCVEIVPQGRRPGRLDPCPGANCPSSARTTTTYILRVTRRCCWRSSGLRTPTAAVVTPMSPTSTTATGPNAPSVDALAMDRCDSPSLLMEGDPVDFSGNCGCPLASLPRQVGATSDLTGCRALARVFDQRPGGISSRSARSSATEPVQNEDGETARGV